MAYRVRVWDLPTRLFHWLLAACVVLLVNTAYVGGDAMQWHARLGYAVPAAAPSAIEIALSWVAVALRAIA